MNVCLEDSFDAVIFFSPLYMPVPSQPDWRTQKRKSAKKLKTAALKIKDRITELENTRPEKFGANSLIITSK